MGKRLGWEWLFPELEWFETREERKSAWQRAGTPHRIAAIMCVGLPFAFMLIQAACFPSSAVWLVRRVPTYLLMLVWGVYMLVIFYGAALVFRRRIQRSLRQQLVERGMLICFKCGYDLGGQTVARCPECGTAFDEKLLRNSEPKSAADSQSDF